MAFLQMVPVIPVITLYNKTRFMEIVQPYRCKVVSFTKVLFATLPMAFKLSIKCSISSCEINSFK